MQAVIDSKEERIVGLSNKLAMSKDWTNLEERDKRIFDCKAALASAPIQKRLTGLEAPEVLLDRVRTLEARINAAEAILDGSPKSVPRPEESRPATAKE
jgi:hypothetical protein